MLQLKGKVALSFVVIVKNVFVDPEDKEEDTEEEELKPWDIEDVVAVETPHIEGYH